MVQYIFTPWRDRRELLTVRRQFYPQRCESGPDSQHPRQPHDPKIQQEKQHGVARVSMWMQRGSCPHLVESTALLTAAILGDEEQLRSEEIYSLGGGSSYAVRAAYSAAFSRFVTGLLDSHQDKQRKMSMYGVAKSVGLPATFVELRHQATHEQLPSLTRLRVAAGKALDWIWEYYWQHLHGVSTLARMDSTVEDREVVACREEALTILRGSDGAEGTDERGEMVEEIVERYGEGLVLRVLNGIGEDTADTKLGLAVLGMMRQVLETSGQKVEWIDGSPRRDVEAVRQELGKAWAEVTELDRVEPSDGQDVPTDKAKDTPAWALYEEEAWIPKPIGVVQDIVSKKQSGGVVAVEVVM